MLLSVRSYDRACDHRNELDIPSGVWGRSQHGLGAIKEGGTELIAFCPLTRPLRAHYYFHFIVEKPKPEKK